MKKLFLVLVLGLALFVNAETKQNLDNTSQAGSISESLFSTAVTDKYVDTTELNTGLQAQDELLELNDVNASSISDGQGLKWDSSTSKFIPTDFGSGSGDMLKSVYDTDDNSIVDNSEKLNNKLDTAYGLNKFGLVVVESVGNTIPSGPADGEFFMSADNPDSSITGLGFGALDVLQYRGSSWIKIADFDNATGEIFVYSKADEESYVWYNGEPKPILRAIGNAEDLEYDNSTSGLSAEDVNSAIDEVNNKFSFFNEDGFDDFTGDGSTTAFTLSQSNPKHIRVYLGGSVLQRPGLSYDYTVSGNTITFNTAPANGTLIRVSYFY